MENNDTLRRVVNSINQGKTIPAMKLVQSSPETAAIVSKLISPLDKTNFDIRKKNGDNAINQSQIQAVSESTKQRITDNESITQIFPDIELAIQILSSSILSPKDMVKTDLIYKSKEPIFSSELLLKLNEVMRVNFEGYYGVNNELQDILRAALFETGSYIKAIIPESLVDEVINSNQNISTEALTDLFVTAQGKPLAIRNLQILGNAGPKPASGVSASLEALFSSGPSTTVYDPKVKFSNDFTLESLEISDNFQLLKLPQVIKQGVSARVKQTVNNLRNAHKEKLQPSAESLDKDKRLTSSQMSTIAYKSHSAGAQTFMAFPERSNAKRKTIGRPLVMRIPSEAAIPVHIPGDETKHIGYFVMVDVDGNPVNRNSVNSSRDSISGLAGLAGAQGAASNGNNGQASSLSSVLIAKAKSNLASSAASPSVDNIAKVYSSIVETNLMERLTNGIYGSNVQIANNEEVYRIMLARALSSKFTRLIYLPAELVTYFAFDFYPNGVGKSYLDNIKNLTSIRAILLFAKVMAQVKSAISLTHVNMTLDPNDPDPQKTIEIAQHEIGKMRQQYFPLGINTPADLVNWIQSAGLEFSFEGHPGIPQTKFDFETKNLQRDIPDGELDETLRKQTYMAFGLSPETVDNGFNTEFATTAVANNILLSKRVIQIQQKFTPLLTDLCRKLISNDAVAIQELKDLIKENIGMIEKDMIEDEKAQYAENQDKFIEDVVSRYIDNFMIDLPRPDVTELQTQTAAFNEYSDALDKAINSWISSEFVTNDISGEISNNIDSLKSILKSYYLRRWMSENGYMSELNDIVTADEEGKPTLDIFEMNRTHMEGLMRSAMKFIRNILPAKEATDKDISNLGVTEGTQDTPSTSDGDDGFGDTSVGGDDGLDLSFDETPVEPVDEAATGTATPPADDTDPEQTPTSDDAKPE